jgi:hypothetical protein
MIDTNSSVSGNPISATTAIDKPVIDTSDTLCQDIHLLLDRIIRSMQEVQR